MLNLNHLKKNSLKRDLNKESEMLYFEIKKEKKI